MDNKVESRVWWMRKSYGLMRACIAEVNGLVQDCCWLKVAL